MPALRLTAVAGVLALAACGSGSASGPDAPIGRLVAYANCMRHHGLPTYPDPDRNGNLVVTPADRIDPGSPQYKRAAAACTKLAPGAAPGEGMTPAEHKAALERMTRYAQCMRKRGVPMQNPWTGPNGGVGISLPPSVDPASALYRSADAACRHFMR